MAQRIQVILEDDLDGSVGDETVRFGLDGVDYEIDLSTANATAIREALTKYIDAGRRVRATTGGRAPRRSGGAVSASREESRRIRAWALENGYEISTRGRVSASIREAYAAAH